VDHLVAVKDIMAIKEFLDTTAHLRDQRKDEPTHLGHQQKNKD